MPCDRLGVPGGVAIVCTGRRRAPRCRSCGQIGSLLCDYLLRSGRTCDAQICARCTTKDGQGRDLCPKHKGAL